MEYRYAKWEEQPDWDLIRRHEREIFPVLKRRHLFADVTHFLLYDFFTPEGDVNENVFAYSNRAGDERALVVYNNRYESTKGWVRTSVAYSVKSKDSDERTLTQKNLGEGLGLNPEGSHFCIFRDHIAGLEYIRNSRDLCERGLFVELEAFKYQVFVDFHEVQDNQWHQYRRLEAYLNGRGTPGLEEIWREILLQPLHHAFRELFNPGVIRRAVSTCQAFFCQAGSEGGSSSPSICPPPSAGESEGRGDLHTLLDEIEQKAVTFLREAKKENRGIGDEPAIAKDVRMKLETVLRLPVMAHRFSWTVTKEGKTIPQYFHENLNDTPSTWGTLLGWLFVQDLGKIVGLENFPEQGRKLIDEWRLDKLMLSALIDLGIDDGSARRSVQLIKLLTQHQGWYETGPSAQNQAFEVLDSLLKDDEVQSFIQVNEHDGILWFNKENLEELLFWLMLVTVVEIGSSPLLSAAQVVKEIEERHGVIQTIQEAETKSEYQVERILMALKGD
jgi:hypothetical protein